MKAYKTIFFRQTNAEWIIFSGKIYNSTWDVKEVLGRKQVIPHGNLGLYKGMRNIGNG